MAQVMPASQPQELAEKPAPTTAKVHPSDTARKGKSAAPESVAVLSLFFG